MSGADDSHAGGADERLFRAAEELAAARAQGRAHDTGALAARHGLDGAEVERVARALEWLADPGADAGDERVEIPRPEVPADYELLEELGRGGMGIVYRARQRSLEREVALKVLLPGELLFGEGLARFRREAKSLARLRHPHIVTIHEVGEHAGRLFYTMDLIEGAPLSKLIAGGELSVARSVRLVRQVAGAVAYVHQRGLLHRDLKPQNVLVDGEGDAFVVDFGLAREGAAHADSMTGSGRLLGTPAYMAPEQARGERARVGEATDVYALGAILYECLTGRAPFGGAGIAETIHAVLHREPAPMRRIDPRIPPALEWIVLRAMAKDPAERYPTAQALQEDLERFEQGLAVRAEPPSLLRRARQLARRERKVLLAVILTLLVVGAGFQGLVRPRLGPSREGLLRLVQELESRGEHAAAAALVERLLADQRGDLMTFRSWFLARLAQRGELVARGEFERAGALDADLASALESRRSALRTGEPLADAEDRALELLALRLAVVRAQVPPIDTRATRSDSPRPAFALVWRWLDGERVVADDFEPGTSETLRWFAAEVFSEMLDPKRTSATSLTLGLELLRHSPPLAVAFADPERAEDLVRAVTRFGAHIDPDLGPAPGALLQQHGAAAPWNELLAALPSARLVELLLEPARRDGGLAARLLAWLADLPPRLDDPELAARVLSADAHTAEALRRGAARGLVDDSQPNYDLEAWFESRALDPRYDPSDPLLALASALGADAHLSDRAALLAAFDRAEIRRRRAWHVLFTLLDPEPDAPRWPGLGREEGEPPQLASAWHLRWGSPPPTAWRLRLGRFERDAWSAPWTFTDLGTLVPDARGVLGHSEPFALVPSGRRDPVETLELHRTRARRFLDGGWPARAERPSESTRLVLRARLGWGPGGFAARFEGSHLEGPGRSFALEADSLGELLPGEIAPVLRARGSSPPLEWDVRESFHVAWLVPADDSDEGLDESAWRTGLARALTQAAGEEFGLSPVRTPRDRSWMRSVARMAAEIALPEALEPLRTLSRRELDSRGRAALEAAHRRLGRPAPLSLAGHLISARLSAGDGRALEDLRARGMDLDRLEAGLPWLARLWLESDDVGVRAAAREQVSAQRVPPAARVELARALEARGEELPRAFLPTLADAAGKARQWTALRVLGWVVLGGIGVALAVGLSRLTRRWRGSPPKFGRPRLRSLAAAAVPVLLLLSFAVPGFASGATPFWTRSSLTHGTWPAWTASTLALSVLFACLAAWRRGRTFAWVCAALYAATLGAQLEGSERGRALAVVLHALAYASIFPCLFERWTFPVATRWRYASWLLFALVAIAPFEQSLLGLSLTLEVWGDPGLHLAGLRLAAWSEAHGPNAARALAMNNHFYVFWLWAMLHHWSQGTWGGALRSAPAQPPRSSRAANPGAA